MSFRARWTASSLAGRSTAVFSGPPPSGGPGHPAAVLVDQLVLLVEPVVPALDAEGRQPLPAERAHRSLTLGDEVVPEPAHPAGLLVSLDGLGDADGPLGCAGPCPNPQVWISGLVSCLFQAAARLAAMMTAWPSPGGGPYSDSRVNPLGACSGALRAGAPCSGAPASDPAGRPRSRPASPGCRRRGPPRARHFRTGRPWMRLLPSPLRRRRRRTG